MTQLEHHHKIIAASRGIPANDEQAGRAQAEPTQAGHWRYTRPHDWRLLGALCAASAALFGLAAIGAWQLAHWCAAAAASLYAGVML